jgi:3-dehydroquinate dehydratase II
MHIHIINGPNLNLLGTREPSIYGAKTFEQVLAELKLEFTDHNITYFQSNIEGEIVDNLHFCLNNFIDAIVINPAAYSHTSIAISDAIKAINIPCIEVHITNIHNREEYRNNSLTAAACTGVISGCGIEGYSLALHYCIKKGYTS